MEDENKIKKLQEQLDQDIKLFKEDLKGLNKYEQLIKRLNKIDI